jgi:hypothetical protein
MRYFTRPPGIQALGFGGDEEFQEPCAGFEDSAASLYGSRGSRIQGSLVFLVSLRNWRIFADDIVAFTIVRCGENSETDEGLSRRWGGHSYRGKKAII